MPTRRYLFRGLSVAVLIVGITRVAYAAPPNGVDHLRGRWDGVGHGSFTGEEPFVLMLDEFQPDRSDPSATLYNGCMAVGAGEAFTPVSARFVSLGNGNYDMTLFGTVGWSVIKLEGVASTGDARVTDDDARGAWQTADRAGTWSASHHDRREPNCPAVETGEELYFRSSINAAVNIRRNESRFEGSILDGTTNIVSSGMRVILPNGDQVVVPFFTDLFSPSADFVDEFRFSQFYPGGSPVIGQPYTFTLLDVFGNPIPGTTRTDTWYACTMDAPRNVAATLDVTGVHVTWNAVAPALGFDPANSVGFYQIELYPAAGGGIRFGSNSIQTPEHLIPFASFGGGAPGSPNGNDYGASLSELPDGSYFFDVISFSEGFGSGSVGLECQIRAIGEQVRFEKSGSIITLLP